MDTIDEIKELIRKFYGDTSRTREETQDELEALRDELDTLIETLY